MPNRWRACAIRAAMLCSLAALCAGIAKADAIRLEQGWNKEQRNVWYRLTQGSRLIPLDWLRALEQPTAEAPFLDPSYIESFRYIPDAADPNALPIGFAVDTSDDSDLSITKLQWKPNQGSKEKWVGMTCSACHTNEIVFDSKRYRIDGGATLADFQTFIRSLNEALVATKDNPQKWQRFAAKVLGANSAPPHDENLRRAFDRLTEWQLKVTDRNETALKYGFGRLDAFGHIYNKVALLTGGAFPDRNPSDAPVSYPFLWNVPQHDKVQWNGIAKNGPTIPGVQSVAVGSLGRNVGEVVGVFADVQVTQQAGLGGYTSSANVTNLILLEQQLAKLLPPAWPGKIDKNLKAQGKESFERHCAKCHEPLERTDLSTEFKAQMFGLSGQEPTGTDPWMACNAYTYQAKPGPLKGTPESILTGAPYGSAAAPLNKMLATVVTGVIANKKGEVFASAVRSIFGFNRPAAINPSAVRLPPTVADIQPQRSAEKQARFNRCFQETSGVLAYKARPLTGIWATPPYLHNGSVPTLYDLLLPPEQRPKSFFVGSREYDLKDLGFVTKPSAENSFQFNVFGDDGKLIDGNWNTGHDYGNATILEPERRAILEYLKSL
ncbi:MAG TPA: di-heme-cytochrome C peroxidase [Dongiaceae bacterium]|nr:di-heme-cytochrome C peroxidase [Dongiaceae bacterium]